MLRAVKNGDVDGDSPVMLVRRRPAAPLEGLVAGIVGLSERSVGPVVRRQSAGTLVPLVISFGSPLTVERLSDGDGANRSYRSFVAGLSKGHATTRHPGDQDCVQVYVTPLGVRRILGVPGSELARRVVAIDDIAPDLGEGLAARLAAATSWLDRLRLVEQVLIRRAEATRAGPDWLEAMWRTLAASDGRVAVGVVVAATGWSHRYVTRTFGDEVGLTPKGAAGILRFERATAELGTVPLADLAARRGYADQSHMTRDFVRYAGEPPAALAAARRPTAHTALGRGPNGERATASGC